MKARRPDLRVKAPNGDLLDGYVAAGDRIALYDASGAFIRSLPREWLDDYEIVSGSFEALSRLDQIIR